MAKLEGRIALVTGASGGVGATVAELLVREGAIVVATDYLDEHSAALIARLGARASFRQLDVASESDWQAAIGDIQQRHGGLDILVNCAAILQPGMTVETTTVESWRKTFAVNAEGAFLACKHALGIMKGRGTGSIVNIASGVAVRASIKAPAYSASKAAVIALTKSTALYCAQQNYGIRVNVILPGALDTPMLRRNIPHSGLDTTEYLEKIRQTHPLGRIGQPEDIAAAVLFLCGDDSRFITGAEIVVDGGQIL